MNAEMILVLSALCVTLVFVPPCHCERLKLKVFAFDTKATQGVYKTMTAVSETHCANLFEDDGNAVSFNFNKQQKKCELGNQLPESSNEEAEGWTLVAKMVDGVWEEWQSWGTCSTTRTRTRLCLGPSNGGAPCEGPDTEEENCVSPNTLLSLVDETITLMYPDWPAGQSVDGNIHTASISHHSKSGPPIKPYWRVDFDSTWTFSTVTLIIHDKSYQQGVRVLVQDGELSENSCANVDPVKKECIYTSSAAPHETTFILVELRTDQQVLEMFEVEVRT